MNSLTWLLAPRSRPYQFHPQSRSTHDSTLTTTSNTTTTSSVISLDKLGNGPRESEAELVDEVVETVKRCNGNQAANNLERRATITSDGQLRFGLPGINERRRNLNLNLDDIDRKSYQDHPTTQSIETIQSTASSSIRQRISSPILTSLATAATRFTRASISTSTTTTTTPSSTSSPSNSIGPNLSDPSSSLPCSIPTLTTTLTNESEPQENFQRLVRLLPIKLGVNLYILIRKFLSIFGLRLLPTSSEDKDLEIKTKSTTSLYSLLWRTNTVSTIPLVPKIVYDEETTNPLLITDASDDSDSTLSSTQKPISLPPTTSSTSSLHPPPRNLKGTTKGTSKPTNSTTKAILPGNRTKTLVLDLDETLIHSTSRLGGLGGSNSILGNSSGSISSGLKVRVVEVVLDGRIVVYHVYKRPWVDFFLKTVASWYTVVIFTASMREYADPVIDWLDQGRGLIDGRLFRESCTNIKGSYVKDLTIVERDLSNVCLVDNSPLSYGLHQANGIPIEGWLNDPKDEGLLDLLPILDSLRFTKDVRRILGLRGFTTTTTTTTTTKSS
ncbi:hypothetical protein CROQUDRAFT_658063 [Cronartium quercuum f. sp. fusiforme G11]|uniref:FCP1 homology domain-containing protein n=1 Tax=Cronartium quercuum f. sp. fusiforme G11 TaxID=708437 RepID=A0A9P6NLY1_9BASI|nr:hypothetical protein CROQUDRAFT_658063 [Cronartium quercuum f. sp. fusiforme G11]